MAGQAEWREEFGLGGWGPPHFFAHQEDIGADVPQAHTLRRAFDVMGLDGILYLERSPVIYFKQVSRLGPLEAQALHRVFWNQGIAPILVLVGPDQVHVYSGLVAPAIEETEADRQKGLVQRLDRVASELEAFIASVGSGEFFRAHSRSFDPKQRVDRQLLRNLQSARDRLNQDSPRQLGPLALDALLCRLIFSCYLFDRQLVPASYLESLGIRGASHPREILRHRSRSEARADLYRLFKGLGGDFNGDLFSDDLEEESRHVTTRQLETLDEFFHAADLRSGQRSLWPYDFGVIPSETISAIHEHLLREASPREGAGAFYTPRFLAELVLDMALEGGAPLLGKRFLDPACGSGIFLVGLFNRLAEEWRRSNAHARHEQQAAGLSELLRKSLRGVDKSPAACRITALSLYQAFLDQLSPAAVRSSLEPGRRRQGKVLPPLLGETVQCTDFFAGDAGPRGGFHVVVSNPPRASLRGQPTPVDDWCREQGLPFPRRQVATAFVWKASEHLLPEGKACFVLPHGVLFNHNPEALTFQQAWLRRHAVERVLNLADYQRILPGQAEPAALVVRYRKDPPQDNRHRIEYWSPKADWSIAKADIINILPQDRVRIALREVLEDLRGPDAPLIWKERFWATPRDQRLLERLSLMPRLREVAGPPSMRKRWGMSGDHRPPRFHGPREDRHLLAFLAAYLESELARFYLFHTSSSWGVSRPGARVEELLRLPFPLPEQTGQAARADEIVREVAKARARQEEVERLVEEYFDVDDIERALIHDTNRVIIPSVRPSRRMPSVPTLKPSSADQRDGYIQRLCYMLNMWASPGEYQVQGQQVVPAAGVGMVILEKTRQGEEPVRVGRSFQEVMAVLHYLRQSTSRSFNTFELVRDVKVFHKNLLFIIKPLGQRFWTCTAALNDADEIAAAILTMRG